MAAQAAAVMMKNEVGGDRVGRRRQLAGTTVAVLVSQAEAIVDYQRACPPLTQMVI